MTGRQSFRPALPQRPASVFASPDRVAIVGETLKAAGAWPAIMRPVTGLGISADQRGRGPGRKPGA